MQFFPGNSMSKIRTFFAVNVSSRVQQNASRLIDRMAETKADYKWVAEENIHITLNFVGDVLETEVADLCRDVQRSLQGVSPFMISLGGLGAFPDPDHPRVVWLGVKDGVEELTEIHGRLEGVLKQWGFPKDRFDFRPHITLGRLRRGGRWNQSLADFIERHVDHDGGMCEVNEVVVNSSYLEKSGPTYTAMSRVALRA